MEQYQRWFAYLVFAAWYAAPNDQLSDEYRRVAIALHNVATYTPNMEDYRALGMAK